MTTKGYSMAVPGDIDGDDELFVELVLSLARTVMEQHNKNVLLLFWPPSDTTSGRWEATWRSPSGRLNRHTYTGQMAMLADAVTLFGVPL